MAKNTNNSLSTWRVQRSYGSNSILAKDYNITTTRSLVRRFIIAWL